MVRRAAAHFAEHEVWFAGAGALLASQSARWAWAGLALCALCWAARWIGRGCPTVRTPIDGPAALLLCTVPVTLAVTPDWATTWAQVARLLAGLALAYAIANWARGPAHLELLAMALAGAGLLAALASPFAVEWGAGKALLVPGGLYAHLPTLLEDAVHPNMMAGALTVLLPVPLAVLIGAPGDRTWVATGATPTGRWARQALFLLAATAMTAALVLTGSRGALVASAAAVCILLVRRWPRLLWAIPVAALALALWAWQGDVPGLLEGLGGAGDLASWEGRLEVWSRAIALIEDAPWTGVGAGTFARVVGRLYPFFLAGPDAEIPHAHNLLLQVGVDLGVPGLVAYLAVVIVAFGCAIEARGRPGTGTLSWAGIAALSGMLIHGTVDATTWIVGRGAIVPWAVIGMLVALARPREDRDGAEPGGRS